jgi:tRNA A37 threonylcarbamoyladenosine modification protein TsaB
MDDPKTKVKIRTLDLLVRITISTQRIDAIKSILSAKLNQVYFEMFVEKGQHLNEESSNPQTDRVRASSSKLESIHLLPLSSKTQKYVFSYDRFSQ